jgi:hypothetical protein
VLPTSFLGTELLLKRAHSPTLRPHDIHRVLQPPSRRCTGPRCAPAVSVKVVRANEPSSRTST